MNSPSAHVSLEQLLDLTQDRLATDERAPLLAHAAACDQCAEALRWIAHVLSLAQSDTNEDAPPHVLARAMRLLRPRAAPRAPGPLRRVLATLRFDSARMPLAFGVRADQGRARHMLFNAEGHDLDLRVTRAEDGWLVFGQVFGPSASGQVELRGTESMARTALNDMRTFALPPVPAGSYALHLSLDDAEIEIVGLELGI